MTAEGTQLATGLTLVLGWLRELSIIGVLLGASWKARGLYDDANKFFERIERHMDTMEAFAKSVVENHLQHIEADMKRLADAQESTYNRER